MNLEQLALLGIGIFGFMALVTCFNAVRTFKRTARRQVGGRHRRLVASPDVAMSVAKSVIKEIKDKLAQEVEESKKTGKPTQKLQNALDEAEKYYLLRVETRYRTLFTKTINEIIFEKKD